MVIIYTVSGGTKAVSITQKQQMAVILAGMFAAFFMIVGYISDHTTFGGALEIAGNLGKLEVVNLEFDITERYTIWSGLAGGFFLALAYFGTDQSQVQRYIGGANVSESRMGLMFNAMLKIPLQFFHSPYRCYGVRLFTSSTNPPMHFKETSVEIVKKFRIL